MPTERRARNVNVNFRCTPEEARLINKKAAEAGMNRTEFLIHSLSEKEIIIYNGMDEIVTELKREGINLNQALRLANAGIETQKLGIAIENCNKLYEKFLKLQAENI